MSDNNDGIVALELTKLILGNQNEGHPEDEVLKTYHLCRFLVRGADPEEAKKYAAPSLVPAPSGKPNTVD